MLSADGDAPGLPPIERLVVDAILGGRIQAGTRLGEQALADVFAVSRTTVREALIRLETRGIVQVVPRRGWFVVEPSNTEAREAFQARLAVELGILHSTETVPPGLVARLRANTARERAAIADNDVSARCTLAAQFHVAIAEALGNRTLSDILLHLMARTVPIVSLHQPMAAASASIDEHDGLIDALAASDQAQAARLMRVHLAHLEAVVPKSAEPSHLADLRSALLPAGPARHRLADA